MTRGMKTGPLARHVGVAGPAGGHLPLPAAEEKDVQRGTDTRPGQE